MTMEGRHDNGEDSLSPGKQVLDYDWQAAIGHRIGQLPTGMWHVAITAVAAANFGACAITSSTFGFMMLSMRELLHLTPEQEGVISASKTWGAALGSVICGLASDRYGRSMVVLCTTLALALTEALLAFSSEVATVCVLRFLNGVVYQGVENVSKSLQLELVPARHRGLLSSLIGTGYQIGGASGVTATYFSRDYRTLALIAAIVPLLTCLAFQLVATESPMWLLRAKGIRDAAARVAWIEKRCKRPYEFRFTHTHARAIATTRNGPIKGPVALPLGALPDSYAGTNRPAPACVGMRSTTEFELNPLLRCPTQESSNSAIPTSASVGSGQESSTTQTLSTLPPREVPPLAADGEMSEAPAQEGDLASTQGPMPSTTAAFTKVEVGKPTEPSAYPEARSCGTARRICEHGILLRLICSSILWMCLCFASYSTSSWTLRLLDDTGRRPLEQPMMYTSYALKMLSNALMGLLMDRLGRKPAIGAAFAIACVSTVVFALANNAVVFFIAFCVENVSTECLWTGLPQLILESSPTELRGTVFGIASALARAAGSVGILIGPALMDHSSAQLPFLINAAALAIALLFWQLSQGVFHDAKGEVLQS